MKIIVIPNSLSFQNDQIILDCYRIDDSIQEYAWDLEAWQNLGDNYLLIVLSDTTQSREHIEIKGFSLCMLDESKECAHLLKITIATSYQSTGLSKILLEAGIDYFLKNTYQSIYLEVRSENIIAQNLYKKFGFEIIHHKKKYYSDGQDAVIYLKKLLSSV